MKKLIAMLLALVMVFALVACTGAGGNDEDTTGDFYTNATYQDILDNDLGSTRWDGSLPLIPEGEEYTLKIGMKTNALVTDYATNSFTLWLEEVTGVNLEIVEFAGSSSDIGTQLSLMITGGEELPDILWSSGLSKSTKIEFMQEGYFLNLAGYFQTDAPNMKAALRRYFPDEKEYREALNAILFAVSDPTTGGMFSFPCPYDTPTDLVNTQAMINMEWLEAVGMEKPTTIEELYDVLVAFRDQDPNGNGIKDEIPMLGMHKTRGRSFDPYIINAFIYYSFNRYANIENGKAYSVYNQDEYRQALQFINKLVKEGLLSDMSFTATYNDLRSLLTPAEGDPFTVGIITAWIDSDHSQESVFVYEPIPALADATGRGGWGCSDVIATGNTMHITYQCERPEIAFRLLDVMCSEEGYLRQRWGEMGVDWEYLPEDVNAEGTGMWGGTARFRTLKDDVISNTGNTMWHTQYSMCSERYYQMYIEPGKNDYKSEVYKKLWMNYEYQSTAGQPEERLDVFWRNAEEDELYYQYSSELSSYIVTARAEFCTGIRDPYDDAAWDAYLKDLQKLHLDEIYVGLGQASYDRQNGK